jgi:hypothetical protein
VVWNTDSACSVPSLSEQPLELQMQLPDQCALRSRLRTVNSTRPTSQGPHNVGDVEFTDSADRELRQRAHAQGLTPRAVDRQGALRTDVCLMITTSPGRPVCSRDHIHGRTGTLNPDRLRRVR